MLFRSGLVTWICYAGSVSLANARDSLAITGYDTNPDGSVALRRSITDLYNQQGPQWDLYIQALQAMYDNNSDNPDSFFQVAGLHGRPFMEWGRTGGQKGDNWLGYCPHGEDIFLTWHRPFVLLFEQILVDKAHEIADRYQGPYKANYTAAAALLRSPFWDWGYENAVPPATVPGTLKINIPSGPGVRQVTVTNPLSGYKYPQAAINGKYGVFDSSSGTRRCPQNGYPNGANNNLRQTDYGGWLYDAFTRNNGFTNFATSASSGISLESIHDSIHNEAACGQQFQNPPYSAFDPLFMLHHTNVDRLWAYWQAIRPDAATLDRQYRGYSRWSSPGGSTIDRNSPLNPFFKDDFSWHTSDSVASIKAFKYSYEGLEYWKKSDKQMQSDATATINRLYGPNRNSRRNKASSSSSSSSTNAGTYKRYFVHISVERSELSTRPCIVQVSLAGQHAAKMYIVPHPDHGIVHSGYSLDPIVNQLGMRESSGSNALENIKSKLDVTLIKPDGSYINTTLVPSLKVEIEQVDFSPPRHESELPTFSTGQSKIGFQGGSSSSVSSASSA